MLRSPLNSFPAAMPPLALEDFIDLDMFSGPSTQSRDSSNSPSSAFLQIPQSPSDNDASNNFFSFFTSKDPSLLPPQPATTAHSQTIDDFLAQLSTQSASPDSGSAGSLFPSTTSALPSSLFTIDPQLVATPSADQLSDVDEDDEDDDDLIEPPAPAKAGGKGKAQRKGTVAGGGITKRTGASVSKDLSKESDDWRPSPEEYKKMTSKEKRQLRNKISARNFRVRRKEYITTLEGDIAERDRLISAIRDELGSSKLENAELRHEIEQLKRAMLDGRSGGATDILPPPAPLTTRSRPALAKANTQKDVSTRAHSFWGGAAGAGGITPVHTTLVPELPSVASVLAGKSIGGTKGYVPILQQQENINPILNHTAYSLFANNKENTSPTAGQSPTSGFDTNGDGSPFTLRSMDAYRMHLWNKMARDLGARDQQLAAHNTAHAVANTINLASHSSSHSSSSSSSSSGSSPGSSPSSSHSSLSSGLRPQYFTSAGPGAPKPSPTLSALLSGKASSSSGSPFTAYPTPPSSPPTRAIAPTPAQQLQAQQTAQHAILAAMVSQSLLSRMGSAFWDAFSGGNAPASSSSSSALATPRSNDWDVEKVRKVLEGRAVVRVVDLDPLEAPSPRFFTPASTTVTSPTSPKKDSLKSLEESMSSMTLGSSSTAASTPSTPSPTSLSQQQSLLQIVKAKVTNCCDKCE